MTKTIILKNIEKIELNSSNFESEHSFVSMDIIFQDNSIISLQSCGDCNNFDVIDRFNKKSVIEMIDDENISVK